MKPRSLHCCDSESEEFWTITPNNQSYAARESEQLAQTSTHQAAILSTVTATVMEQAIANAVPITAEQEHLAQATNKFLARMRRKEQGELTHGLKEPESVQDTIYPQAPTSPLKSQTMPEWLQNALTQPLKREKIGWVRPNDLLPISIDAYCLNDEQIAKVVLALKQSSLDNPHPLVTALKANCEPSVLESFAWSLYWRHMEAPTKDKWPIVAMGLWGTDASVAKLAYRVLNRSWHYTKIERDLQALQAIGTDSALWQINQLAQPWRRKSLRRRAQQCMERIALQRGLTYSQLEDRIVPDCGLDVRSSRIFDYGCRKFQLVLDDPMKLRVRDERGKLRCSLPKPRASDDAELASSAIEAWNLLQEQIHEVVKTQSHRLQRAMWNRYTWQREDFERFVVQHPVMIHLVRSLVWAGYDNSGQLVSTFRITEDRTYANAEDDIIDLKRMAVVGIMHPDEFSAHLRATWGEVMSDYELMPPFPQLTVLHSPQSDEEERGA